MKPTRLFFLLLLFCALSNFAKAQTTGPSQTEYQSYGSNKISEMVNLFTGDFSYSIPLLEIPWGGEDKLPVILNYQSGSRMNDEASWVGFGWNVNPGGNITREMRGIPDDFNKIPITHFNAKKPDKTYTFGVNASTEIIGGDLAQLGASFGITAAYNNYRGLSLTRKVGLDFNSGKALGDNLTASAGLDISFDNAGQSVVSLQASLKGAENEFNANTSLSSREGMSNLQLSFKSKMYKNYSEGVGLNFNFAKQAYTPNPGPQMVSKSIQLDTKIGPQLFPVNLYGGAKFSYTQTEIKDPSTQSDAYGYMYLPKTPLDNALLDFNREKDGILSDKSPNLASPNMTYDIFNVTGEGVSGSFRAYRTNIPVVYDKKKESDLTDNAQLGLGVEVGAGNLVKVALNANASISYQSSGRWSSTFAGASGTPGSTAEEFYFKFTSETNLDRFQLYKKKNQLSNLRGLKPIRAELETNDVSNALEDFLDAETPNFSALNTIQTTRNEHDPFPTDLNAGLGRDPRASTIQHFTNAQINNLGTVTGEFAVEYIDANDNRTQLTRSSDDRIGAFIIHTQDGKRYVYALPVYNIDQVESRQSTPSRDCVLQTSYHSSYSVSNSEEFKSLNTVPEYAYAFLLTSILGSDYVDFDSIPGISSGDLGSWLRFEYIRKADYIWRSPFENCNYEKGFSNDPTYGDNKESFMSGHKQLYYLNSITSKSHTAVFTISSRMDGYGARTVEQAQAPMIGSPMYRLDEVKLFSVENLNTPIKTVKFDYDYSLVPQTPNTDPNGTTGKLTLTKVFFTHDQSNRGLLSPYEFSYHNAEAPYRVAALDRWGNYDSAISECDRSHITYTPQKKDQRAAADRQIANWQLKDIILPSGGKVSVSYESDDYAYVQNRRAMQMCRITSRRGNSATIDLAHNDSVYFELNEPVDDAVADAAIEKYFDGVKEVFFKVEMKLRGSFYEFVEGYAKIVSYGKGPIEGGKVHKGWVKLKKRDNDRFHPFAVAAWQHMRFNQPDILYEQLLNADGDGDFAAQAMKAVSLADMLSKSASLFRKFNENADDKNWGDSYKTQYSLIRLNAPDKRKYGGGLRVKKITIDDQWNTQSRDPRQVIGQVYYYTHDDGSSSGVASYEPIVGGEENPFRESVNFRDDMFLSSDHYQYFEMPTNEAYFPAPVVGYSKVRVRSLAADSIIRNATTGGVPHSLSSTGETVHEYFTAKEYPTVASQTTISRRPFRIFGLVPFIASLSFDDITASQGFAVENNNMHGQPMRITYFGQKNDGTLSDIPVKKLEYFYTDRSDFLAGGDIPTQYQDDPLKETLYENVQLMDTEVFADMRESKTYNAGVMASANADIYLLVCIPPLIVNPSVWPGGSFSQSITRTIVINKVIHHKYVLDKMVLQEAGNLKLTKNHIRDAITGDVVLSSVNNKFGRKVYSYNIPAYWKYKGLGPAYRSVHLTFEVKLLGFSQATKDIPCLLHNDTDEHLYNSIAKGDEYFMNVKGVKIKVFCKSKQKNGLVLQPRSVERLPSLNGEVVTLQLIRPGRRNMLTAITENLTTLKNPLHGTSTEFCYPGEHQYIDKKISYVGEESLQLLEAGRKILQASNKTAAMQDPNVKALLPANRFAQIRLPSTGNAIVFSGGSAGTRSMFLADKNGNPIDLSRAYDAGQFVVSDTVPAQLSGPGSNVPFSGVSVALRERTTGLKTTAFLFTDIRDVVQNDVVKVPKNEECESTPSGDPVQIYRIDSVLNVSVTTYSDNWPYEERMQLRFKPGQNGSKAYSRLLSDYAKGEKGVWRVKRKYSYLTERVQHSPVNLQHDGIFDEFIQFDWQKEKGYCAKWVLENEVKKYSPFNFPVEQQNVLTISTTAIYGYNNLVNTAFSRNATTNELGFEGFEEYMVDQKVTPATASSGNIDFQTEARNLRFENSVVVDVVHPYSETLVEIMHSASKINPVRSGSYRDKGNIDPVPPEALNTITAIEYYPPDGPSMSMKFAKQPLQSQDNYHFLKLEPANPDDILPDDLRPPIEKGGKFKIQYDQYIDLTWQRPVLSESDISISEIMAHTGRRSLRIKKDIDFQQTRLHLTPGKEYVFSCWISLNDATKPTYASGTGVSLANSIGVVLKNSAGEVFLRPVGPVIEGWQKVEGEFTGASGSFTVRLQKGSATQAFFDDLRISPLTSLTETYVYDTKNYRLSAILDNNNFASLFSYDEEGNLFLVQKETDRGRYTVKEIRAHTYEH